MIESFNILVVDDSRSMRMLIKKMLESAGLFSSNIMEAENGLMALDFVESNNLDLIFTDINMPNMSGLDLVKEIKAKGMKIPIIVITTDGSQATVVEAIQNGAVGYIKKPFNAEQIKDIVQKHLVK